MTPQARFLKTGGGQIISAGLDAQLNVLNTKGLVSNNKKAARGFTCLETLPTTANSKVGLEPHLHIIVCADTSQQLRLATYDTRLSQLSLML